MKSLLILFSLVIAGTLCSAQNYTLTGVVKDKRGEVLPGAGVYVSGYKIAVSSDNNGAYKLSLKPGNYDILVQLIGYKALNKNVVIADKDVKLDLLLEESVTQLAEVTIKPDPNRAYYIALFKDFFVGTTPNAAQCKLINPNVLIIDYDQDNAFLTVKSNQFLIIENKALGYRIKYLINNFEYSRKTNIVYYQGFPTYEDLKGSKRKKAAWDKMRLTAYLGSPQHFFKSLFNKRVSEEGFIINKLKSVANSNRPKDSLINASIRRFTQAQTFTGNIHLTVGDSLNYWMRKKNLPKEVSVLSKAPVLQDTLARPTSEPAIQEINFTDKLYVVYTKEPEDAAFTGRLSFSISRPPEYFGHQISTITLQQPPVYFYENGGIYNPRSMLFSGYWAWEKIADSVPMDYLPPKP